MRIADPFVVIDRERRSRCDDRHDCLLRRANITQIRDDQTATIKNLFKRGRKVQARSARASLEKLISVLVVRVVLGVSTSGQPQQADNFGGGPEFAVGPNPDITTSFDHIVDQGDHCLSDGNPQHLGSRDIDDKLEFCGLLDRRVWSRSHEPHS